MPFISRTELTSLEKEREELKKLKDEKAKQDKEITELKESRDAWMATRVMEIGPGIHLLCVKAAKEEDLHRFQSFWNQYKADKPMLSDTRIFTINREVEKLSAGEYEQLLNMIESRRKNH